MGLLFTALLFAFVIVLVLAGQGVISKYLKTENTLIKRVSSVILFYLISSSLIFLNFGLYWGEVFGLKVLPVLSLVILLILELIQLAKDVLLHRK